MRTTLVLDDGLFKRAKRQAAQQGTSLSEVVNQALRAALAPAVAPSSDAKARMLTFGDARQPVQHEPKDFDGALTLDYAGTLGR